MPKIIVIEGVDGSGKTTLARQLEREGYRYRHHGKPAPGEDLFQTYTYAILRARGKTVFDRLHLGETVYGPVVRGVSQLQAYDVALLDRLITARGGITIICSPPYAVSRGNWQVRLEGEMLQDLSSYTAVYGKYVKHADNPYYGLYDYTNRVGVESWQYQNDSLPPGYLGYPGAKLLVVGERVNPRKTGYRDLPFYDRGGCSRFLTEALYETGFKECELVFTNAQDIKGKWRNLTPFLRKHPTIYPIFLGKVAHELSNRTTIPKGFNLRIGPPSNIVHPQLANRFPKYRSLFSSDLKEVYEALRYNID